MFEEAALDYAARGYLVFPCVPGAKKPLTPNGWMDATADLNQIRAWWAIWPEANVALYAGGLLVVDVDVSDAPNEWDAAPERSADLNAAPTAFTPRGGRHYVFSDAAERWRCSTSKLAPKVDVRAVGGYFLVAPSVVDDRYYEWVSPLPSKLELPPPPAWLEAVNPAVVKQSLTTESAPAVARVPAPAAPLPVNVERRAVAYLAALPAAVSGSGGHSATYAAATCLVHGFALAADNALDLLARHYNPRCVPPWTEAELRHKIKDAAEKPHDRPYGWLKDTERPSFPPPGNCSEIPNSSNSPEIPDSSTASDADAEAVADVVSSGQESVLAEVEEEEADAPAPADPGLLPPELLRCPGFISELMDYTMATAPRPNQTLAFCGALALMAFLGGRKIRAGKTRTNIYLLSLADSSVGKDWPRTINKNLLQQIGLTSAHAEQFGSGQGLEDALTDNPCLLAQTDEIDAMLQGISRETSGALYKVLMEKLLSTFSNAASFMTGRKLSGRDPVTIHQPCLVLFGTAIPVHYYAALNEQMLSNGLFGRMLIFEAGARARRRTPETLDLPERVVEVAKGWANRRCGDGNLADLNPTPAEVEYTAAALAALEVAGNAADDEYDRCFEAGDACGKSVWGRAEEMITKLALLYAISESHDAPRIDAAAVEWAAQVMDRQIRRALYMVDRHVISGEFDGQVAKMRVVLEAWKTRHGEAWMPGSYLHRRFRALTKKGVEDVVAKLQQMGIVALLETDGAGRRGWKVRIVA